jgi:hypothetical protein
MAITADMEIFGEGLNDDELALIVQAKREEESVLGALKELIRRKSARRHEIFRAVLADPGQSVAAKKTVVAQLGREDLAQNQELLLRHLDVKDASVFAGVVQSLGQIGNEQALERLEKTAEPDNTAARRALEFARSFLAYRWRLDSNLIATPPGAAVVEVTDGIPIEAARAGTKTVRKALQDAKKELPAVRLAEQGAVKLTCRSTELLLVFTDEFWQPRSLATLRDRSALPVVLLKNGLSLERYFLAQYFFTHPSEGGRQVALLGTRPGGELTYVGSVESSEKEVTFTVRSLSSRYVPAIEVEGRYDPGRRLWKFTRAVTTTTVAAGPGAARAPRRVSPRLG